MTIPGDEALPQITPSENTKEWVWDPEETTNATVLKQDNQEVCFHPSYSSGTAAVRGNMPFTPGRDYFWEIEMLTPLYGTDVMVGVGTGKADLKKFQFQFGSLLGSDEESWGYSYNGRLIHNGILRSYGTRYCKGNTVGVHLDMWRGILTFYLNRQSLGVAFKSLKAHKLYPMVSSTAARSAMRLVCSYSCPSSLQLLCLKALGTNPVLVEKVKAIPGLRVLAERAFWQFFPRSSPFSRGEPVEHQCCQEDHMDDDFDLDYSHSMYSGEFYQSLPISLNRRQPVKRASENPERCYELRRQFCVECRRLEKTNDQSNSDEKTVCSMFHFVRIEGGDLMEGWVTPNRRHSDYREIVVERTIESFLDNN